MPNEVTSLEGGDACNGEVWVERHDSGIGTVSWEGDVLHDNKGRGEDDSKTFNGTALEVGGVCGAVPRLGPRIRHWHARFDYSTGRQ